MANLSSAEHIAHLVDVMNSAAENLIKHQGQAERVRTKATRTTREASMLCAFKRSKGQRSFVAQILKNYNAHADMLV